MAAPSLAPPSYQEGRIGNASTVWSHTVFADETDEVVALAVSQDGAAALGLASGGLQYLSCATTWEVQTISGHNGGTLALSFCPAGLLVSTGGDGCVRIWARKDPSGGRLLRCKRCERIQSKGQAAGPR